MLKQNQTDMRSTLIRICALISIYAFATVLGAALFIGLLRAASIVFGHGVMFYRGVGALSIVLVVLTIGFSAILSRTGGRFDFNAVAPLSISSVATALLLVAFVIGPVTVDRSISIFMLSEFDSADHPLGENEVRDAFVHRYVDDWGQIDRRLREQELSGNIESTPSGWRITQQGRAFMTISRMTSRIFDGNPRFVGRNE